MRIPRIYTPQPLAEAAVITLEAQASQHLARVLRMQPGQLVELFNGQGTAFSAEIREAGKKQVSVTVGKPVTGPKPSPLVSEIAVCVSKGDKMDLIVQKCTELGVTRITPVTSQRSDVKLDAKRWQKKHSHWQQVMISACEQCGRNDLVDIDPVVPLTEWLASCKAGNRLIFHPHQATAFAADTCSRSTAMCFGPEGGFDDDEIRQAMDCGFQTVTMGPRVLRAETAPLAALAVVQVWQGDFAA